MSLGIIGGLVIGKQVGVTAFAWLAVKVGLAAGHGGASGSEARDRRTT